MQSEPKQLREHLCTRWGGQGRGTAALTGSGRVCCALSFGSSAATQSCRAFCCWPTGTRSLFPRVTGAADGSSHRDAEPQTFICPSELGGDKVRLHTPLRFLCGVGHGQCNSGFILNVPYLPGSVLPALQRLQTTWTQHVNLTCFILKGSN